MPKVFVNAPPPPNGVLLASSGTGNGPRGMDSNNAGGRATLAHPIVHPKSEAGKTVDDVAQLANNFGTWLGGEVYKALNK